jgi:hypothetical protein
MELWGSLECCTSVYLYSSEDFHATTLSQAWICQKESSWLAVPLIHFWGWWVWSHTFLQLSVFILISSSTRWLKSISIEAVILYTNTGKVNVSIFFVLHNDSCCSQIGLLWQEGEGYCSHSCHLHFLLFDCVCELNFQHNKCVTFYG